MFTSSGVSLPRSIKRESASSGLFEGAIGVIGPAEGGLSASTAHGVASFHVSTSRLTTTPGSESGARCTNLAGITRAGKRMDPKLADLSEASERRSFTSGGSLGRTRARGEETRWAPDSMGDSMETRRCVSSPLRRASSASADGICMSATVIGGSAAGAGTAGAGASGSSGAVVTGGAAAGVSSAAAGSAVDASATVAIRWVVPQLVHAQGDAHEFARFRR